MFCTVKQPIHPSQPKLLYSGLITVEFLAKIKNGIIEVPRDYWDRLRLEARDEQVRIIMLTTGPAEMDQVEKEIDSIDQLLANPLHITDFTPLSRSEAHGRS